MTAQVRFLRRLFSVTAQMENRKCNDVCVILGVSIGHMLICVMCVISRISPLQNVAVFSRMVSAACFFFSLQFLHVCARGEKMELQRYVNATMLALPPISKFFRLHTHPQYPSQPKSRAMYCCWEYICLDLPLDFITRHCQQHALRRLP